MIDTQIDGGEIPVQTHAVGWLMAIPFAITDCQCAGCNGELVPTDAFEIMFQPADEVSIETLFDDDIGDASLQGTWIERAHDMWDDVYLLEETESER